MKCLSCNTNDAQKTQFGYSPCAACAQRMRSKVRKTEPLEFVTENIKEERKRFAKDILQPFRAGELSKEYVEKWGTKHLKVTPEEVKKSKNVWSELEYYD